MHGGIFRYKGIGMSKKPPDSFAGIMAHWPTLAALAADIGVPLNTVLTWSRRGVIPRARWPTLIAGAKLRRYRVTASMLEAAQQVPRDCSTRVQIKRSRRPVTTAAAASRAGATAATKERHQNG